MPAYAANPLNNYELSIDSMFLTQLQLVVDKHKCSIRNIDLDNKIVDIDCNDNMSTECAIELSELFDKYLV